MKLILVQVSAPGNNIKVGENVLALNLNVPPKMVVVGNNFQIEDSQMVV